MKSILKFVLILIASAMLLSCTENERAKNYGGTLIINLDSGQKLVDVTWKETSLWYMTKPMVEGDVVETYTFKEESSYGLIQGKVIFKESK
jgi:hypothetical protein